MLIRRCFSLATRSKEGNTGLPWIVACVIKLRTPTERATEQSRPPEIRNAKILLLICVLVLDNKWYKIFINNSWLFPAMLIKDSRLGTDSLWSSTSKEDFSFVLTDNTLDISCNNDCGDSVHRTLTGVFIRVLELIPDNTSPITSWRSKVTGTLVNVCPWVILAALMSPSASVKVYVCPRVCWLRIRSKLRIVVLLVLVADTCRGWKQTRKTSARPIPLLNSLSPVLATSCLLPLRCG